MEAVLEATEETQKTTDLSFDDMVAVIDSSCYVVAPHVHEWTGLLKVREVESINTQDGSTLAYDEDTFTGLKTKLKKHEIFKEFSILRGALGKLLHRFTVYDPASQLYLLPENCAAEFFDNIEELKLECNHFADRLAAKWNDVKADMRLNEEVEKAWHLIEPRLPQPSEFKHRFCITCSRFKLTRVKEERIQGFQRLTMAQQARLLESSRKETEEMLHKQVHAVIDTVFGEVEDICSRIVQGEFDTGKRRAGALTDIMAVLGRLLDFKQFSNTVVSTKVEEARNFLKTLTISDINHNVGGVQTALKKVMGDLGADVTALKVTLKKRAVRDVVY